MVNHFLNGVSLSSLLSQSNGNRARAFFALTDLVFDNLAFAELLNSRALDFGVVKEQVAPLAFDESKTLVRQYFLDLTFWHCCLHKKNKNLKLGPRE